MSDTSLIELQEKTISHYNRYTELLLNARDSLPGILQDDKISPQLTTEDRIRVLGLMLSFTSECAQVSSKYHDQFIELLYKIRNRDK